MRSVFVRARGASLLLFLVLVTAVPTVADDLPPGMEPPQARIHFPPGVASEGRIQPPVGVAPQGRIHTPPGVAPQGRLVPPVGVTAAEKPLWELFLIWLQGRIHTPVG